MALALSIETDSGPAATYWRITTAHWNYVSRVGTIYVAGYISKEARDSGKTPLVERLVLCRDQSIDPQTGKVDPNELPFIDEPNRASAYGALASLPMFAGAVSV